MSPRSRALGDRSAIMITVIAIILSFSAICHGRSTEEPCPFVSNEVTANDVQDVIVVGGGAAGTFAAWRLQHSKIVSRVLLLEATNRIGGRLYTEHVPGIDYQMAELGGMRYFPDFHPYMKNLITRLQLETKVFQMDEDNERRPWFLRNRFFQQKDMKSVGNGAYQLREDEKSKNPEDVTRLSIAI
jgi:monoamine oxidase